MRKLLPLVVTLWCACEPVTLPVFGAPHILSLSPLKQDSVEPVLLQVQLDQEPRFRVDYGSGSAERLEQPTVWLDEQPVTLDTYLGHGLFQGVVPTELPSNHYNVRLTLEDGLEATWANGYQVIPEADFYVETIGNQIQDQPFTVTVRTLGENAEFFQGTVTVKLVLNGDVDHPVQSRLTGAFSEGVRQEQLSVSAPGTDYVVVVERNGGRRGASMSFQVTPRN